MKKIYSDIWKVAKSYYKKGRPMDLGHVSWMMKEAEKVCKKEKLDDSLIMPAVILHDVGYSVTGAVYYDKKKKGLHMKVGAKLTKKILTDLNYPQEKIKKICYFISVHDNWIYGETEIYKKNKELGVLRDLDFLWILTPDALKILSTELKKTKYEYLIEILEEGKEKSFSTKTTKKMFDDYTKQIK